MRTTVRKIFGRSDYQKWGDPERLREHWDARTARLGQMVPPNTRVLEFGAGRLVLRDHLPPGCTYTPTDLVPREPGMIACDLNARRLPGLPSADVAVFSGVFEFVNDVPRTLGYLREHGYRYVVASYMSVRDPGRRPVLDRRKAGVVNEYTREGFVSLLAQYGFRCVEEDRWHNHDLFRFERAEP